MKVIILAGGSGTRLWPLSRDRFPKQFIKLREGVPSLFQSTFERGLLLAGIDDIYVVTNEKYKFLVMGSIGELGIAYNEANILVEPEPKNTLPAIYAGVREIARKGNDSIVVFPSDHMIRKSQEFAEIIRLSEPLTKDSIVTFGAKPDGPNTGYGYILPGDQKLNGFQVNEYKEKPTHDVAVSYVAGGYFWNAGIFLFNSGFFTNEVKQYAEEIYNAFETSVDLKEVFSRIHQKISIDYGIMEKSQNITVVPVDIGWNDLGSFDSFYDAFEKDENNNIIDPANIVIESSNNFVYSEKGKLVSIIGVDDLIVVDNRDTLLICKKGLSQKVKEIVETLKARNDSRTEYHVQDYRIWGNCTVLEEEKNSFKVKRIIVSQGKKISYQMHQHRNEHWIVVKGMAKVTIDDIEKFVSVGENVFIKLGQKHQLENQGRVPLELIEIQTGDYLEEDDIIRFDDNGIIVAE